MKKLKYFTIFILISYLYRGSDGLEKKEYKDNEIEENREDKIPFGTPKFFLFILYAFSKIKSYSMLCWNNVWSHGRLLFNKSSRT